MVSLACFHFSHFSIYIRISTWRWILNEELFHLYCVPVRMFSIDYHEVETKINCYHLNWFDVWFFFMDCTDWNSWLPLLFTYLLVHFIAIFSLLKSKAFALGFFFLFYSFKFTIYRFIINDSITDHSMQCVKKGENLPDYASKISN